MEQDTHTYQAATQVFQTLLGITYSMPAPEPLVAGTGEDEVLEYAEAEYNLVFGDESVHLVDVAINLEDPESDLSKAINWQELLGMSSSGRTIEDVEVLSIKVLTGVTRIA